MQQLLAAPRSRTEQPAAAGPPATATCTLYSCPATRSAARVRVKGGITVQSRVRIGARLGLGLGLRLRLGMPLTLTLPE